MISATIRWPTGRFRAAGHVNDRRKSGSEINVNRRVPDLKSSLSDVAGAAGWGTAQWQHVRLTTREMCNPFSPCSRVCSVLLRCSICLIASKKLAVWVTVMAPRSLTFVELHLRCPQFAGKGITRMLTAIAGSRVQSADRYTMKPHKINVGRWHRQQQQLGCIADSVRAHKSQYFTRRSSAIIAFMARRHIMWRLDSSDTEHHI